MKHIPAVVRSVCLLAIWVFAALDTEASQTSSRVPRWSRFELTLNHAQRYADPYRDVTLEVTYTRPDGRRIVFWGFHDGGQTWRARFMPDLIGTWTFEAKFSDGSVIETGTFDCIASDLPGQISVYAANPLWFGWRDGEAALLRGLHVGDRFFAKNWDDPATTEDGDKRTAFLDWAGRQGYNTLSIASHYLNRQAKRRGEGWDTPKLWPLDATEFRRMEAILNDLEARRFLVYPFAGFFGRTSEFPRDPADQTLYLRYTLARIGAYWNVLFNLAGPEPLLRREPFLTVGEINRLGVEIVRLDPFRHLLSVHNAPGDDPFRSEAWHTYSTLQGPKTFDRARLRDGILRNLHPPKPVLAQETLWSGNSVHIQANKGSDYSDTQLRKNAFVIHFSGANFVFADNRGDSSTGFSGSMDHAERRQPRHDIVKRVWDAFAELPWQRTTPRPDLVSVTGGGNAFCLAEPGRIYLVYLDASGTVDVRIADGPYRVEWINAQNAADRRPGAPTTDGQNLVSPQNGDDWILRLSR